MTVACGYCESTKTKKHGGPKDVKGWLFVACLLLSPMAVGSLGLSSDARGVVLWSLLLCISFVWFDGRGLKRGSKWTEMRCCRGCGRHFLPKRGEFGC